MQAHVSATRADTIAAATLQVNALAMDQRRLRRAAAQAGARNARNTPASHQVSERVVSPQNGAKSLRPSQRCAQRDFLDINCLILREAARSTKARTIGAIEEAPSGIVVAAIVNPQVEDRAVQVEALRIRQTFDVRDAEQAAHRAPWPPGAHRTLTD